MSRAEDLVAAIRAMPVDALRRRLREARGMTHQQIVGRWEQENRDRAVAAARRIRGENA